MILRHGFKVIKSKDGIKACRMLGDGIYFSNVLDEVASYVGDMNTNNNGYGRLYGSARLYLRNGCVARGSW